MNKMKWVFSAVLDCPRYKIIHRNRHYLVWGTGIYGEAFAGVMERMDVLPRAFIDSDVNKQGKIVHGIPIMDPESALAEYGNADVILAMTDSKAKSLKNMLRKIGRKAITLMDFLLGDVNDFSVLEIGPLHNPCFKGANVKYMDVIEAGELLEKAEKNGLPTENVPERIDYVSPDGDWDVVKEKFDLIYSSHLLEHQTNFVKHLQDVQMHVYPGGAYVLAVPDKRYCFNHYDPCTRLEDVLAAYYEKRSRHSLQALIRAACTTHNDVERHWQGDHGRPRKLSAVKMEKVVAEYKDSLTGGYIDVHEWYFIPESLSEILQELRSLGLIDFKSFDVCATSRNTNSFGLVIKY